MAQVPEVGQDHLTLAQNLAYVAPVETRGGRCKGTLFDEQRRQHAPQGRQAGGEIKNRSPIAHAPKSVEQMRGRRTDRQSPHQEADAKPAIGFRPGGHDLHPNRIDPRQEHSAQEAQNQRQSQPGRQGRDQPGCKRGQQR